MIRKLLKFVGWMILITMIGFLIQSQLVIVSITDSIVENQNILQEMQDRTLLILNQQMQEVDKKIDTIIQKPSFEYLKSVTVVIRGIVNDVKPIKQNKKHFDNGVPVVYQQTKEGWIGTGVIIKITDDFTYILTNKHVAGMGKKNSQISIVDSILSKQATIIKYHPIFDMAIIRIEGKLEEKIAIKGVSISSPQDNTYLVGHHLGRNYVYGEGVFAGYDRIYSIIQIPCLYGNSGSGVFDKDGNLTSLIFAITVYHSSKLFPVVDVAHGIAIDGASLKIFLKEYVE